MIISCVDNDKYKDTYKGKYKYTPEPTVMRRLGARLAKSETVYIYNEIDNLRRFMIM